MDCQAVYQLCPAPAWPPQFPARLSNSTHVGSVENQEALAQNINAAILYMKEQRRALECYEAQARQE